MTRAELKEYRVLKHRVLSISLEIKAISNQHLSDSVNGSSTDYPYTKHPVLIGGICLEDQQHIFRLQDEKKKCLDKIQEIESFVDSLGNEKVKYILNERYLGRKKRSWQSIAFDFDCTDESTPRKLCDNYLEDPENPDFDDL